MRLIVQSPRLASLEELGLDCFYDAEGHGEEAARLLLAAPHLSRSLLLYFSALHELTDPTRAALADRFRLLPDE